MIACVEITKKWKFILVEIPKNVITSDNCEQKCNYVLQTNVVKNSKHRNNSNTEICAQNN